MDSLFARFFGGQEDAEYGYHRAIRAQPDAGRILNIGCGRNVDLQVFRAEGREVWGVDFVRHPELTEPARFRLLGADGRVPFPDASFDVATARWVLEHVAQPGRFLAEIGRVLRPGGRFVALTVHGSHYVSWLSRLADWLAPRLKQRLLLRLYGRPMHDTFPAYYRLNTATALECRAVAAGLELESLTGYANPDYFRFAPLLRRGAILTDWLLQQVRDGMGHAYLVVTLRKPLSPALSSRGQRTRSSGLLRAG